MGAARMSPDLVNLGTIPPSPFDPQQNGGLPPSTSMNWDLMTGDGELSERFGVGGGSPAPSLPGPPWAQAGPASVARLALPPGGAIFRHPNRLDAVQERRELLGDFPGGITDRTPLRNHPFVEDGHRMSQLGVIDL